MIPLIVGQSGDARGRGLDGSLGAGCWYHATPLELRLLAIRPLRTARAYRQEPRFAPKLITLSEFSKECLGETCPIDYSILYLYNSAQELRLDLPPTAIAI
jgi:hypothetical protein